MIEGDKYWSCKQSVESESYGDNTPAKPWQGILKNNHRGVNVLYRFNKNNVIDKDPNAYSIVEPDDLFQTEQEAIKHYKFLCCKYAEQLMVMANFYLKEAQ